MAKEVIETLINTTALALTSLGVVRLNEHDYMGYLAICFGMGLEFLKYYGRKIKLW